MSKKIKISLGLFGGSILSAILHNVVYGIWGVEEGFFFILTLILFLAFLIYAIFHIVKFLINFFKKNSGFPPSRK